MLIHTSKNFSSGSYSLKFWIPDHQHIEYFFTKLNVVLDVTMQDILHIEYKSASLIHFSHFIEKYVIG